jgi:hypothetical protein
MTPQLRQYPSRPFWIRQERTRPLVSGLLTLVSALLTRFLLAYLVTPVAEL